MITLVMAGLVPAIHVFFVDSPTSKAWNENLYEMIFGQVITMSIYNPAHFRELMRRRGYQVSTDKKSQSISATKTEGARITRLENMYYFGRLTGFFLMSDETVMMMLDESVQWATKEKMSGVKIEFSPQMKLR